MWICIHKKYIILSVSIIFSLIFLICYTSIAYFDNNKQEQIITNDVEERFRNIYKSDKKIAYLTFDDGPSKYTTLKVLDVLKRYDIKATFFVLRKMC